MAVDVAMIPAARPEVGEQERAAVDRVMRSGMLAGGPEVAAFEQEFSAVVAGRECIAVNSGTSALHMAFIAGGIKPGDEVIVPSFTFAATANSVALAGGPPGFAGGEGGPTPRFGSAPPRLGKSLLVSKLFPAYWGSR